MQRRAAYTVAVGYSRVLMGMLIVPGSQCEALPMPEVHEYCTENSDRYGLNSWHADLSTEQAQRNFFGRWAAKDSSDVYVRTAIKVVENLQMQAATG